MPEKSETQSPTSLLAFSLAFAARKLLESAGAAGANVCQATGLSVCDSPRTQWLQLPGQTAFRSYSASIPFEGLQTRPKRAGYSEKYGRKNRPREWCSKLPRINVSIRLESRKFRSAELLFDLQRVCCRSNFVCLVHNAAVSLLMSLWDMVAAKETRRRLDSIFIGNSRYGHFT